MNIWKNELFQLGPCEYQNQGFIHMPWIFFLEIVLLPSSGKAQLIWVEPYFPCLSPTQPRNYFQDIWKHTGNVWRHLFKTPPLFPTFVHNSSFTTELMFTTLLHSFCSQLLFPTQLMFTTHFMFTTLVNNFHSKLLFIAFVQNFCKQAFFPTLVCNSCYLLLTLF